MTTGARSVFLSVFVDLDTPLAYRPRTFTTAAQVRDYVAPTPAAWGYVDLAFTRGLHIVPYEGVPCTRATIVSGAYPARRPLGLRHARAPARRARALPALDRARRHRAPCDLHPVRGAVPG